MGIDPHIRSLCLVKPSSRARLMPQTNFRSGSRTLTRILNLKRTLADSHHQRDSTDFWFHFLCICEHFRQLPGLDPEQVWPHCGQRVITPRLTLATSDSTARNSINCKWSLLKCMKYLIIWFKVKKDKNSIKLERFFFCFQVFVSAVEDWCKVHQLYMPKKNPILKFIYVGINPQFFWG